MAAKNFKSAPKSDDFYHLISVQAINEYSKFLHSQNPFLIQQIFFFDQINVSVGLSSKAKLFYHKASLKKACRIKAFFRALFLKLNTTFFWGILLNTYILPFQSDHICKAYCFQIKYSDKNLLLWLLKDSLWGLKYHQQKKVDFFYPLRSCMEQKLREWICCTAGSCVTWGFTLDWKS